MKGLRSSAGGQRVLLVLHNKVNLDSSERLIDTCSGSVRSRPAEEFPHGDLIKQSILIQMKDTLQSIQQSFRPALSIVSVAVIECNITLTLEPSEPLLIASSTV